MSLPTDGEKGFDQMKFRQELATMDEDALESLLSTTDRKENFLKFTLIREEIDRRQTEKTENAQPSEEPPIQVKQKPLDPKVTQAQFEASRLVQQSRLKVRRSTGRYVTGEHLRQKVESAVDAPVPKKATVKIKNYRAQLGFKEDAESLDPVTSSEQKSGAFTIVLSIALVMIMVAFAVCVIAVFDLPGKEPLMKVLSAVGKLLGASSSGAAS